MSDEPEAQEDEDLDHEVPADLVELHQLRELADAEDDE